MSIHVSLIEAFWIAINFATAVITLFNLTDARRDRAAIMLINGPIRKLIARGNIRREVLRLVVQVLLLSVAAPGLLVDREITLSPALVALICVPVILLVSSLADRNERHELTVLSVAEVVKERDAQFAALSQQITEGSDRADAAYAEANTVNTKISDLNDRLIEQGERAEAHEAGK